MIKNDQEHDLPEILAGILLSDVNDIENLTIDDFYDFVDIPIEYRNDFATGCLISQANCLYRNARK